MIKINLAKMKQAKVMAESTSSGLTSGFSKMSMSAGDTLIPILRKVVVPLGLAAILYVGWEWYAGQQQELMQAEVAQLESQRAQLAMEANKIRGFEKQKEEIDKNELVLRKKIETIQKLLQRRDYAAKALMNISKSLTSELWLTTIAVSDEQMRIKGSTVDVSQISDFMSAIELTPNFKDVTLRNSLLDKDGSRTDFELEAKRE